MGKEREKIGRCGEEEGKGENAREERASLASGITAVIVGEQTVVFGACFQGRVSSYFAVSS